MTRPLGSRYVIGELIGRGGMGEVHAGRDSEGNPVAIKVLRRELAADPDLVTRFVRERNVLLGVRDPHLVRIHDLVVEGDTLAIVMDLVPGQDLRRAFAGNPMMPAEAARVGASIARGLDAVHSAGVVHRDVKPENVLLDTSVTPSRVMLTDFGISRVIANALGGPGSATTLLVGTPYYMAPELWGGRPPSPGSDLYALGVLLYELCCGVPPFVGDPMQVMQGHLELVPGRPEGLPQGIWDLLDRLLAKAPTARPPGAGAVAARLDALQAEVADLSPAPRITSPPRGGLATVTDSQWSLHPAGHRDDLTADLAAAGPRRPEAPDGPPATIPLPPPPISLRRRHRGAVIAGVSVTVVVLGVSAVWALPALSRTQHNTGATTVPSISPSPPSVGPPSEQSPSAGLSPQTPQSSGIDLSGAPASVPAPIRTEPGPGGTYAYLLPGPTTPACMTTLGRPENTRLLSTRLRPQCRADVKQVQQWLIDRGYPLNGGADGHYGQSTETAIQQFQKDRCLRLQFVGIGVGPITWDALRDDSTSCQTTDPRPSPAPVDDRDGRIDDSGAPGGAGAATPSPLNVP